MNLIDLIEELEGAGLIITSIDEIYSELLAMGYDPEFEIPCNEEEEEE